MCTHARNNTDLLDLSLELADKAAALRRTWLHNALIVGIVEGIDQTHAQTRKIVEEANEIRAKIRGSTEGAEEIYDVLGATIVTVKEILATTAELLAELKVDLGSHSGNLRVSDGQVTVKP
jgi:methyl-accepting chemotaxis protein